MNRPHTVPTAVASAAVRKERILVVGTARSGTSWLAKAIGHADNTQHLPEPDNIDTEHAGRPAGYLGFGAYPMLEPGDTPPSLTALWDFVFSGRIPAGRGLQLKAGRRFVQLPRGIRDPLFKLATTATSRLPGGPAHRVVKSIFIMFSLDWMLDRYHPQVVLIQRNPRNTVSSWMQLNIPSFDLATRPLIRERYLDRLGIAAPESSEQLHVAAWTVGLLTTVIAEGAARHPEWPLYTHEDLCVEPRVKLREVCDRVGLTWGARADRYLEESNRPGEGLRPVRVTSEQPDRWKKRLTTDQVSEIDDVLSRFPTRGWIREPGSSIAGPAVRG